MYDRKYKLMKKQKFKVESLLLLSKSLLLLSKKRLKNNPMENRTSIFLIFNFLKDSSFVAVQDHIGRWSTAQGHFN